MKTRTFNWVGVSSGLIVLLGLTFGAAMVAKSPALPRLVDTVRGVIGPQPVAFTENTVYGLIDAYNRAFRKQPAPGYWTPTAPVEPTPAPVRPAGAVLPAPNATRTPIVTPTRAPVFPPHDLPPLYPNLAAPGEGVWLPIPNAFDPASPLMYKTFLHPDSTRPYARVAIVAMDLTRLRLHAVAGTAEPAFTAKVTRTGLIPAADRFALVAAFNGGWRTMHGHFGMMVRGQTILPPQTGADTIAIYPDGRVRIAPWTQLATTWGQMESFRQTPSYLLYHGQLNPALADEQRISWGASVSGKTVIWRSALGISADGRTLFYAAGESLTARTIAEALRAVGANNAAELDVNWSFERFLIYAPATGNFTEQVLLDKMIYQPGMYVFRPAARDFFYVTRASGR